MYFSFTDTTIEQKRRQAIRGGFDRITMIVPGLESLGRSEAVVLQKTVAFGHAQMEEREELIRKIEAKGGEVDPELQRLR